MKRKITAVITSRNDDYGGNLKERASVCLNHMIHTFDEVIYVDWNSQGKTLVEELKPYLNFKGNLRVIRVTPDQHKEFTKNDPHAQPVVETLGHNIGLRRATGDIIVSTNIDIIPPTREHLDVFIDSWFDKNTFYTISRRDITLKELKLVKTNFDEKFRTYLTDNIDILSPKTHAGNRWCRIMCCGDFQLAHKDIWNDIYGFEESMIYRFDADAQVQMKAGVKGYKIKPLFDLPVFHIYHEYDNNLAGRFNENTKTTTENLSTWGFSNIKFEEEIL